MRERAAGPRAPAAASSTWRPFVGLSLASSLRSLTGCRDLRRRRLSISTRHGEGHREVDVALRDVQSKPSPISATPIRIRNDSASILIVGCVSTKSPIGFAANIMMPTAITMASTITGIVADHADRGDHRVEREDDVDDRDLRRACRTKSAGRLARGDPASPSPSSELWISSTDFASRKSPPPIRIRSRPENALRGPTENSGSVRRIIHASESSSPMRISIASARPMMRARVALLRRQAARPGSR